MERRTPVGIRILNAEPDGYSDEARAILSGIGEVVEERVPQAVLAARVRDVDVLIVRLGLRVTREVLDRTDRLKAIVTATTGLDHIDVAACAERGVAVLSLRGETEFLRTVPATAEHTWALLLALVRRIPWAFDSVRRGEWDRDRFRGHDLAGRRLGLVGLGRVGTQVARYGLAFGMTVGAYDRRGGPWITSVDRFTSLEDLLRWSQVLSIHASLNEKSRHLLTRDQLALLPRGAVVVNTARGAILDESALVALLDSGHLAGAAVDVLADDIVPDRRRRTPLLSYAMTHDTVIITPHLGGATRESMRRTEIFMADKLRRFVAQLDRDSITGSPLRIERDAP